MPAPTEQSLREDIRFLGAILGDTIREQEGKVTFDLIENIRRLSVQFHRDGDAAAGKSLTTLLKGLSPDKAKQSSPVQSGAFLCLLKTILVQFTRFGVIVCIWGVIALRC